MWIGDWRHALMLARSHNRPYATGVRPRRGVPSGRRAGALPADPGPPSSAAGGPAARGRAPSVRPGRRLAKPALGTRPRSAPQGSKGLHYCSGTRSVFTGTRLARLPARVASMTSP